MSCGLPSPFEIKDIWTVAPPNVLVEFLLKIPSDSLRKIVITRKILLHFFYFYFEALQSIDNIILKQGKNYGGI